MVLVTTASGAKYTFSDDLMRFKREHDTIKVIGYPLGNFEYQLTMPARIELDEPMLLPIENGVLIRTTAVESIVDASQ